MRSLPPAAACFDVGVVGGGSAGVAAALGAARAGARTVLIERESRLGGNVSQALVHTICGLYAQDDARARPEPAHGGLPARLERRLLDAGAAGPPERAGRVHYLPIEPRGFAALCEALCRERPGLELRLGAELRALRWESDRAELALCAARQDESAVAARIVIDTTGDATAAALGGGCVAMAGADELQRPSYVFKLAGAAGDALAGVRRMQLSKAIADAVRSRALPDPCASVHLRPGLAPGEIWLTLTVPRCGGEPYAPLDPAYVEALGKRVAGAADLLLEFLRGARAGFAQARIEERPVRVGIRETRRIAGRRVLSRDDVLCGRGDPDEVARSHWPLELWEDHRRARLEYPSGACSIPLGALVHAEQPRLGAAGRCLSATHEALGALRVIGTALATGEAIGVAAALAADRGCTLAEVAARDVRAGIAALPEESRS